MTILLTQKTKYLFFVLIAALFISLSGNIWAQEPEVESSLVEESLVKHNALESKISYEDLQNIIENSELEEDLTEEDENVEDEDLEIKVMTTVAQIEKKYEYSASQINSTVGKIDSKAKIGKILAGNYLGVLRFQLVQLNEQETELSQLKEQAADPLNKDQIESQIKILQEDQADLEKYILQQENKFSLFGWVRGVL